MIGFGLKKFALANGMKAAHGVAYGNLRGFAVTMSEGGGWKRLSVSTRFPDAEHQMTLQNAVNQRNISREFRVQSLQFAADGIHVIFSDTVGTMKRIEAFVDWFFPLLGQAGVTGYTVCPECGGLVSAGKWKLVGGMALYVHDTCAERIRLSVDAGNEQRRQENKGSYGLGLLGAILGALLGAIVWAVVLNLGYVASFVGLLVGFLAEKGYTLLGGKTGKGKVPILIVAVLFGVFLGTMLPDAYELAKMISAGELPGLAYSDIPSLIHYLFAADEDYRRATLSNGGIGLLFAALGTFSMFRRAGQEAADEEILDLE